MLNNIQMSCLESEGKTILPLNLVQQLSPALSTEIHGYTCVHQPDIILSNKYFEDFLLFYRPCCLQGKSHRSYLLFRDDHVRFEDLPHQAQARQEAEAEPSDPPVDQVRCHYCLLCRGWAGLVLMLMFQDAYRQHHQVQRQEETLETHQAGTVDVSPPLLLLLNTFQCPHCLLVNLLSGNVNY